MTISQRAVSEQRLRKILERQETQRFGANYIPSTLATREEAPSISRPTLIESNFLGRAIHAMSEPEANLVFLALYCPHLIDLHEQKMLCRWPSPHPMAGMPGVDTTGLPPLRGTVDVANRLGYLDLHPSLIVSDPDDPTKRSRAPFPYQGDLLLFINRRAFGIYCVNWTVKDKSDDFTAPPLNRKFKESFDAKRAGLARFDIEDVYYSDAKIRTQPIANEELNLDVKNNLRQIYPYTFKKPTAEAETLRDEIVNSFNAGLITGLSGADVIRSLAFTRKCSPYDAKVIFYQAIWYRQLRLDFFKPILIDCPMRGEEIDVLDFYAGWFLP